MMKMVPNLTRNILRTRQGSLLKRCQNHSSQAAASSISGGGGGLKSFGNPCHGDLLSEVYASRSHKNRSVLVRQVSLMKRCYDHHIPQAAPVVGGLNIPQSALGDLRNYRNPCLDLFYYVVPKIPESYCHLRRLLPPAWSYCPLTTLSIIRSFLGQDRDLFLQAICWLHHNHPKTLACNLVPLLTSYGNGHSILISILQRILKDYCVESESLTHSYPDLRFLRDQIAHLFAESLIIDIQNLEKAHENESEDQVVLEVTSAAENCDQTPFLMECVARRVFPEVESLEVAREQLRNKVLEPLNKALNVEMTDLKQLINIWGYRHEPHPELFITPRMPCSYLKELEKFPDRMVADALLPNELVNCCISGHISRQVVELQWKAMVDNLKKKQLGVLSHSLAVIHFLPMSHHRYGHHLGFYDLATGLAILISELSEEDAWKGKVIPMSPKHQLLSIQGHDLKSKCEFLSDPANSGTEDCFVNIDCKEVFDLILQQAVNQSLKPEQMIKRVFVFSILSDYEWVSTGSGGHWEAQDYEEMQNKYKAYGYDMPPIVFWKPDYYVFWGDRSSDISYPFADSPDQRGMGTITGFQRAKYKSAAAGAKVVKMFLENDGRMSPQHVMGANVCDDYSHPFAVLD